MIPRFGNPREPGRRYRRRPGAYAVLWRDGQLLVTHQSEPVPEFQLPGGGVDPGESPVQALHREVYEETGWHISSPRRLGSFRKFTFMPEYDIWAEKLCMIYFARPVRQVSPPSERGHAAHWIDPGAAVELLANDGDAAFVQGVIEWLRA